LEADRARLQGQFGELVAEKSRALQSIGETQLQMRQLKDQFSEEVSKDMAEVQTQIGDIRQRFIVAQDAAQRIDITAPMAGTAQNLRVFTDGAVIRPGDPLVDIAPEQGRMVIQARFSPNDVDSLHLGDTAELRFSAFHSRTIPVVFGKVHSVSRDRLADEVSHQPYYLAIVSIDQDNLPPEIKGKLVAGMPADVVVQTGARTALQYIWQPLTNALHQSMRER
jgi:HlyD family type I secretion membrane fusion protein